LKRALANSTLRELYISDLDKNPFFDTRDKTWDYCIDLVKDDLVAYVEFGVYEGNSIKYFVNKLHNEENFFIGLDLFTGLPEDWETAGFPKGTFDVKGAIPQIADKRVTFIPGMFQDTSQKWMGLLLKSKTHQMIAHFDADLYSSTLYGLTKLASIEKGFYAIFDEFYGDECRALSDFLSAFQFKANLLCSGARCYEHGGHKGKVTQRNVLFYIEPIQV